MTSSPVTLAVPPRRAWLAQLRCGGSRLVGGRPRPCRSWLGVVWSYRDDLVVSTELRSAAWSIRFFPERSAVMLACPVKEVDPPRVRFDLFEWRKWIDSQFRDWSDLTDKRRYISVAQRAEELGHVLPDPGSPQSTVYLDARGGVRCAHRHNHPISPVAQPPWNYDSLNAKIRALNPRGGDIIMRPAPSRGRRPRHQPDGWGLL